MPEKNISDIIQTILDKNKGFMILSKLRESLGTDIKQRLGIKSKESSAILRKKIEAVTEDRFMFHKKGSVVYILTPCEPSELVLGLLSSKKALDSRTINALPFKKDEFTSIINALIDDGKAIVRLDKSFTPQIFKAEHIMTLPVHSEKYTQEKFREAFNALDKGRVFVRICDIRRMLGWPRDVFDHMLTDLRDKEIIQLHVGDASTMTIDEVNDCFTDENGFRMGSVTWHV